jgi:inward rectifier potassium channel
MNIKKKSPFNDFGLGDKATSRGYRALNKEGSFNIKKINIPFYKRINIFHELVTISWPRFFAFVFIGYLLINFFFASLYYIIGIEHLTGILSQDPSEQFMEAFFFSAQTITTLGYGQVAPIGLAANIVAATESLLGLLSFALATGLMYGRFSKPVSSITYSTKAVIAPYKNINGFMFRVYNAKKNQLLEVETEVSLSLQRQNSQLRDFYALQLERSRVVFFPSVWTVVHPITEDSPLYNLNSEDLDLKDAEFIVTVKAFDDSSLNIVYSRSSYKPSEIAWGEKFKYLGKMEDGKLLIDVKGIDDTERVDLNT